MASAADLQATLDDLGLGFLFSVLQGTVTDPNVDVTDVNSVGRAIDADPVAKESLKQRFSGNQGRVAAGLQPLKPAEYIALEKQYVDVLRMRGMPVGFYDTQADLAKLIAGSVSPIEFSNRIDQGYRAAMNAPQNVKQQLTEMYNITDADLAAYYLDPTRSVDVIGKAKTAERFGQQIQAAQISAQAQQQANIQLGVTTAEELAAQGVSAAEAAQGFTNIALQQELYQPVGTEQAVTQEQQVAGEFGPAAARQAIAERRRRRQAGFEAGGGFATGQAGNVGLTTA